MREIKFRYRFKNDETGEIFTEIMTIRAIEDSFTWKIPAGDGYTYTILSRDQFTGKKDQNDVEIYFNDKVSLWYEEHFFEDTVQGEIDWDNGCSQVVIDFPDKGFSIPFALIDISYSSLEVIGNIYDPYGTKQSPRRMG